MPILLLQIEAAARAAECRTLKGACKIAWQFVQQAGAAAAGAVHSIQWSWPSNNRVEPLMRAASVANTGGWKGEEDSVSFQVGQKRTKCEGVGVVGEGLGSPADDTVATAAVVPGQGALAISADAACAGAAGVCKPPMHGGIGRGGRPLKSALKSKIKGEDAEVTGVGTIPTAAAAEGPLIRAADIATFKGTSSEDAMCVMQIGGQEYDGVAGFAGEGGGTLTSSPAWSPVGIKGAALVSPRTSLRSPSPKVAW